MLKCETIFSSHTKCQMPKWKPCPWIGIFLKPIKIFVQFVFFFGHKQQKSKHTQMHCRTQPRIGIQQRNIFFLWFSDGENDKKKKKKILIKIYLFQHSDVKLPMSMVASCSHRWLNRRCQSISFGYVYSPDSHSYTCNTTHDSASTTNRTLV